MFGGDSWATVFDGYFEMAVEVLCGDLDGFVYRAIRQSVLDQVAERAGDDPSINTNRGEEIQSVGDDLLGGGGVGNGAFFGGFDDIDQVDPLGLDGERGTFHPRYVEKIVEDALESLACGVDFLAHGICGGQTIQSCSDDGDGSFEFMRHGIEKDPVELFGFGDDGGLALRLQQMFPLDDEGELERDGFAQSGWVGSEWFGVRCRDEANGAKLSVSRLQGEPCG